MSRVPATLFCLLWAVTSLGQTQPGMGEVLSFEAPHVGNCPAGWYCNPPETITADNQIVHGGKWSVRLDRQVDSPGPFSTITDTVPIDFAGKAIQLSGFIRTENVRDFAGLWIREDGDSGPVEFANMEQKRPVKGTTPWTEYSLSVPLNAEAKTLVFGFLLSGPGKAWADDLRLEVDGKPVEDAPNAGREKTPLDTDREFDHGSKITLGELNPVQIANLATLGRVWGFLKYNHPVVTAGKRNFDYDLFRIMPAILAAHNPAEANTELWHWVDGLGNLPACTKCAQLDRKDLYMGPDLGWLSDEALLGHDLSHTLRNIEENRAAGPKQFYVSMVPQVGNPAFAHEPGYAGIHFPDSGFQILALFRYWNMIEYWYPYRDMMGEDWNTVLKESIPKLALARDQHAYLLQTMALIARVHDSHANLWSSFFEYPPGGNCAAPVTVRFVEKQAVVAGFATQDAEAGFGLVRGDVIEQVGGADVNELVKQWRPYYGASNEAALLRNLADSLTRGDCGKAAAMRVRRGGKDFDLNVPRVTFESVAPAARTHDLGGDTFQRLSKDVAYLKLSSIKASDADRYVEAAAGTKGLIIDIRNYPSEFVVFALGQHLVERPTPFAVFTAADAANPGAFHWGEVESLAPSPPHYRGKIVILVDEVSQSQAEYTAMAFRAAPNAIVMGSTTAGADGDVSPIALPGGLRTMISGIGVFYPNRRPTQRAGIVPDVQVTPTIAGIAAKRDEVIEAARHYIEKGR